VSPGNGHKIIDWDKFREFVKTHGDKTQAQMAALWEGDISARTISRALNKIGWTRKKRLTATKNAMKTSFPVYEACFKLFIKHHPIYNN